MLAKPQLDDLGFRSTKHETSLDVLGLSFPAVLPEEHASTLRGESVCTLKADEHRTITPPAGQWLPAPLRLRRHGSTAIRREAVASECAAPLEAGGGEGQCGGQKILFERQHIEASDLFR